MSYLTDSRIRDMAELHIQMLEEKRIEEQALAFPEQSAAATDDGKAAEIARTADEHQAAAKYHAAEAHREAKAGNTGRANAHTAAAAAHLRAAGAGDLRQSTLACLASAEAHGTGKKFGPKKTVENSDASNFQPATTEPVRQDLYSDDQERDANGRWSGAGGPESQSAQSARTKETYMKAARDHRVAEGVERKRGSAVAAEAHRRAANAHESAGRGDYGAGPNARKWSERADRESSRADQSFRGGVPYPKNPIGWQLADESVAQELGLVTQILEPLAISRISLDEKVIPDEELQSELRGKGLVRAKPFPMMARGLTEAKDGRRFLVDDKAVASLLANGNDAPQPTPFNFSHRKDPVHGADQSGYVFSFSADPKFVYADTGAWTRTAASKIADGSRGFISPEVICEPLDPETLETLDSAMLADGSETNTWRPLAFSGGGLVPNPALPNIPPVTLSTEEPAQAARKENEMDPKLLAYLDLPATATKAQVRQALAEKGKTLGIKPWYLQALADGEGGLDKAGVLAMFRKAYKLPDVVSDEMLADMISDVLGKEHEEPAVAPPVKLEDAPAAASEPQMMARLEKMLNERIGATRTETLAHVEQTLAQREAAKRIDGHLLRFEEKGAIVAAERENWRKAFATLPEEFVLQQLEARETGPRVPLVTGTRQDPSVSVDRLPKKHADEILSRAAAWMHECGTSFEDAFYAVRGGDKKEEQFHLQVLASNPDWGLDPRERTRRAGAEWNVTIRSRKSPGLRSVELDTDMLKQVEKVAGAGGFRQFFQEMASKASDPRVREQFLSDASNFQPSSRFMVPNFAAGFVQGEYAGPELAPDIVGGANQQASYPVYATEQFEAPVGPDGYPQAVGRNAKDIEKSRYNVDFQNVTLFGYANIVECDRRDQSAGAAVLPIGVLADSTDQALHIEQNKREKHMATLYRTAANYAATSQYNLDATHGGAKAWDQVGSKPLEMHKKASVQLWHDVGQYHEATLIPPDVLAALQYHADFIRFAQIAFQGQGNGGVMAYVPEALIAIALGPILVPTARVSSRRGGTAPDTLWGRDVILFIANKGKLRAPRAFANVVSAGYPIVRTFPKEEEGLIGSDHVKVSDMYAPQVVGLGNDGKTVTTATKAAFLFQDACLAQGQTNM